MEATPPSYALLFQLPLTLTILIKLYKPRTFPKIASTCSTKTRMEKVYPSKWNIDAKREKDRSHRYGTDVPVTHVRQNPPPSPPFPSAVRGLPPPPVQFYHHLHHLVHTPRGILDDGGEYAPI